MLGLLRFDFFAMRKKMATFVCLLLPAICALLVILVTSYAEGRHAGLSFVDVFISNMEMIRLNFAIYFVLLLHHDRKKGYIKNVSGTLKRKYFYILSKAIVLSIFVLISFLLLALTAWLGCLLAFGSCGAFEASTFWVYFGVNYILMIGSMCLLMFVTLLLRNIAGSITFAVLYIVGLLPELIYGLLELLLAKMDMEFNFFNISVYRQMRALTIGISGQEAWKAVTIAGVYILLFGLLSCVLFHKRDTV